jgi:hypothetical protein
LFQTGYLTIKEYVKEYGTYILNFPNEEVKKSFNAHLLTKISCGKIDQTSQNKVNLLKSFENKDIKLLEKTLSSIFASIPYDASKNISDKESFYHSVFYISLSMLGANIMAEYETANGRVDLVLESTKYIYIMELKTTKQKKDAITQIKEKKYYEPYLTDGRQIILLGINFDIKTKNVKEIKELVL